MLKNLKIPRPTELEVKKYLNLWNSNKNFYIPENALEELFKGRFSNEDINDVLVKVYALNDAYRTNIRWQVTIAEHIVRQKIDNGLDGVDLAVVDKIRKGHSIRNRYGTEINFYSFATKYCSFHRPDKYPLFDSNVKTALIYFKKNCEKFTFNDEDLTKYNKFVDIIQNFKEVFDLPSSFRDIDKYLYLVGRELNPPKNKS